MNGLTIEQLEKDRADLQKQLEQAILAWEQARQRQAMIEGALQLLDIQIGRLENAPEDNEAANEG